MVDPPELRNTINPCGMIMDYLPGTAYRTRAVLWLGNQPVTIEWFPVHQFAEQFPYPRAIFSNRWLPNNTVIEGIGELDDRRTWVPEVFAPYSGETFCGKPEWFLDGVPADAPTNLPPCPKCIIPSGLLKIKIQLPSSIKGDIRVDIGITAMVAPEGRSSVKVPVASAIGGSSSVKMQVAGQVATGAYSTAHSSAWDTYRFV